ncbi:Holliday junction resolvase RuvX [bacterium]|nr:Holliday junction resolvase RuvX [bacterium]
MRILAVDYGERRTGLAVTDELGITAQGLDTLVCDDEKRLHLDVARVAAEVKAERIVVGLPLNMNGSESEKSAKVRVFAGLLASESALPVIFWDERMTTMQAHRVMKELGMKNRGRKNDIDRISATLILQEYLKTLS